MHVCVCVCHSIGKTARERERTSEQKEKRREEEEIILSAVRVKKREKSLFLARQYLKTHARSVKIIYVNISTRRPSFVLCVFFLIIMNL